MARRGAERLRVDGGAVEITNPDKVLFPAARFTKRHLIDYYVRVAPLLLPHFKGRPVALKRYPDGVRRTSFWEKDAPSFTPTWVKTTPVWRRSGESQIHYIVIDSVRTLAWCAQIASIELHPFLHRARALDRPTSLVFDLDPGEGAGIMECADVAFWLRAALEDLKLASFVKVSGSKGLQVYCPLNTRATYDVTQPFARSLAERLQQEHPREVVSSMSRALRVRKVFIDWSQNADHKTTVGVYSVRAKRDEPFVSMPVTWDELQKARRAEDASVLYWSPEAALERIERRGDLFEAVLTLRQFLPGAPAGRRTQRATPARPAKRARSAVPRRSAQGSRRRFLLERVSGDDVLRLEIGEALKSWRVKGGVPVQGEETAIAIAIPDASIERLERAALGAGDIGQIEIVEGSPRSGSFDFYLTGKLLRGAWNLSRDLDSRWVLTRSGKSSGKRKAGAKRTASRSVAPSGASAQPLTFVPPMTATLAARVPAGDEWLYEVKLDGYRAIAVKHVERVQLLSRKGNSLTDDYPSVAAAVARLPAERTILDGEIVALDAQGRPSFQALQQRARKTHPILFYAFDLLHLDGVDLRRRPLVERKRQLEELIAGSDVRLSETLEGAAAAVSEAVKGLGLEGIVAKRKRSRYQSARSGDWLKIKFLERQEFVIAAYKPGFDSFESLIVGYHDQGRLRFAGKVRNGYTPQLRRDLWRRIHPLETPQFPFADRPSRRSSHWGEGLTIEDMTKLRWLEPVLVAEVGFVEWTRDGNLRHPTFLGLRPDKSAREVVREEPADIGTARERR